MIESHNRDVLARVAERDPDPRVRQAAVQRLAELRGLLQSIIRLFVE